MTPTGLEPVLPVVKGRSPRPLDEGGRLSETMAGNVQSSLAMRQVQTVSKQGSRNDFAKKIPASPLREVTARWSNTARNLTNLTYQIRLTGQNSVATVTTQDRDHAGP